MRMVWLLSERIIAALSSQTTRSMPSPDTRILTKMTVRPDSPELLSTDTSGAAEVAAPRALYAARLANREAAVARFAGRDLALSRVRLGVFAAAALMAWLALRSGLLSPWWLAALAMAFGALVVVHARVLASMQLARRGVTFYRRGLDRLDHAWAGQGLTGDRFRDEAHPYAVDLDLFGRGSLFELLCTARTGSGESTLAGWLCAPASPDVVRARQEAVRELTPRLDLREDLARLGDDVRAGVHPEALARWGTAPAALTSASLRAGSGAAAAFTVITGGLWLTGLTGPLPVLMALALNAAVALPWRRRVLQVVHGADMPSHELALLADVLERLEREAFTSAYLVALRADLETGGATPSQRIRRLGRLIDLLDARRNQMFAPFSYPLLWATQCACAIEAWRRMSGDAVPRWGAAVGELEALCSLAGYAFENPADPFPAIVDAEAGPMFDGDGLGHPLIPRVANIRNDVRLAGRRRGGAPSAWVVSGSNMSGKSTLLRTVGINVVLALAGAPVRARRLTLTPLAVGATLRIEDSLQAGTSRFYAEITRLRAIVDLTAGAVPPLFLLDELLNGTNSHDRRVGAESLVRGLITRGAIGLVTTHDLALAEIAESLAPLALNVHFEDHLEGERMTFDYRCRPGVVTRSNALALMRAVGLEL
jgi:hypothetical protein